MKNYIIILLTGIFIFKTIAYDLAYQLEEAIAQTIENDIEALIESRQ